MKWFVLLLIFLLGLFLMFKQMHKGAQSTIVKVGPPPTRAITEDEARQKVFDDKLPLRAGNRSENEFINKDTRAILNDMSKEAGTKARWLSVDLLYRAGDQNGYATARSYFLTETNQSNRLNVVHLVKDYKDMESFQILALAAQDWDEKIKTEAISALASFDTPETLDLLTKLIKKEANVEMKPAMMESIKTVSEALEQKKQRFLRDVRIPLTKEEIAAEELRKAQEQKALEEELKHPKK